MTSGSDGEAAHGPDPIADRDGGGDLVPRDSDSDATLVLPGRGSDHEESEEEGESGEEKDEAEEEDGASSSEEGDGRDEGEVNKEVSDDAMEDGESEMEVNASDVDVPEGPSSSNGVRDVGPVCERYGPGKMCDGRGCHPCMNALQSPNGRIYKTPDSKSRPIEKDMSEEKAPMPANPEAADVTWLVLRVGFGVLEL